MRALGVPWLLLAAPWLFLGRPGCSMAAPWQLLGCSLAAPDPPCLLPGCSPAAESARAVLCRSGPLPKRSSAETILSRSGPLPKKSSAETVLGRSGTLPKRSSAKALFRRSGLLLKRSSAEVVVCEIHERARFKHEIQTVDGNNFASAAKLCSAVDGQVRWTNTPFWLPPPAPRIPMLQRRPGLRVAKLFPVRTPPPGDARLPQHWNWGCGGGAGQTDVSQNDVRSSCELISVNSHFRALRYDVLMRRTRARARGYSMLAARWASWLLLGAPWLGCVLAPWQCQRSGTSAAR